MSTVATSKANIQRILLETDSSGNISQQNYFDNELWQYFNEGMRAISIELMKWNSKLDLQNTTLTYAINAFADTTSLAALAIPFLSVALDEKSRPKVFNATESAYPRMTRASESDIDSWESEDNSDSGTPDQFYLRGLNFYIHPRAKVETNVKIYYNPLRQIVNDASTMPWNDLFNNALEIYVVSRCRMRSELAGYNPQLDMVITENLRKSAWDVVYQREGFRMNFDEGCGWD